MIEYWINYYLNKPLKVKFVLLWAGTHSSWNSSVYVSDKALLNQCLTFEKEATAFSSSEHVLSFIANQFKELGCLHGYGMMFDTLNGLQNPKKWCLGDKKLLLVAAFLVISCLIYLLNVIIHSSSLYELV